jgi:pantoate--beta-alanine ligase
VFCPSEQEIYPEPDNRVFDLGSIGSVWKQFTSGHFNGVAQVVTRLFDITTPDRAYFGIKDFQQVRLSKRCALICFMISKLWFVLPSGKMTVWR